MPSHTDPLFDHAAGCLMVTTDGILGEHRAG